MSRGEPALQPCVGENCHVVTDLGGLVAWSGLDPWQAKEMWDEMFGSSDIDTLYEEMEAGAWHVERYVRAWLDDKVP